MNRVGTRLGPYHLRRLLGAGGMGQVFAAYDERLNREVALKLLLPEAAADVQLAARFRREGEALARIPHAGVVQVLSREEVEGTLFFTMELLKGRTLRERMREAPRGVALEESLALARRIAEVMADLHAQGILHRDLKPENVFLCDDADAPGGYRPKLVDFGTAKVPTTEDEPRFDTHLQTHVSDPSLGTPRYMAPEQLMSMARVDGQADVYALGIMLFELLAGRPPFDATGRSRLAYQHEKEEPSALQSLVSDVPERLSLFIARMLAKNPQERPSMQECREAFGRPWEPGPVVLPGLAPFTETQSGFFFGREPEIRELLDLLEASRTGAHRWVQLEGPRGVGKTSLVHAGLLPPLTDSASRAAPRWQVLSGPLAVLLERLDAPVEERVAEGTRVLVVLEDWEGLVLLDGAQRRWLDERLSTALTREESRLRLLTTMREDALPLLEQLPRLSRLLNGAARYVLRPLEGDTLVQVIRKMAERSGLKLSEGLPERMVREATSEGDSLPLLAHTLQRLRAEQGSSVLTHERYEARGGVGRALAQRAEEFLAKLHPAELERAKWTVLSLVQVSRGRAPLRRSSTWREVLKVAGGDALAENVLRYLSGQRAARAETGAPFQLLRASDGPEPGDVRVTLLHDALLHQVPTLVRWLNEERARLEGLTDLDVAAQSWELAGCPRGGLATGTLLQHYLKSARAPSPHQPLALTPSAVRFLDAARRFDRRQSALRFALALILLASTAWAFRQQRLAEASRGLAEDNQLRAEDNQKKLIGLILTFVKKSDWVLGRRAYTFESRRALFDEFIPILDDRPSWEQNSLLGLSTRITVLHRRADLAFHDESLSATGQILDEAERAIRQGQEAHPDDLDLEFDAAMNASKRGKYLQALGQSSEARILFARAIAHFKRHPVEADPKDYYRSLATSYAELADLDLAEAHPSQALEGYGQAIQWLEQNVGEKDLYDRSLLIDARGAYAEATSRAGDPHKASRLFDAVLKDSLALTREDPGDTYFRLVRTRILLRAAAFRSDLNERDQAVKLYREALPLARALRLGELPNKRHGLALAECLQGLERLEHPAADGTTVAGLRAERCGLVEDFQRQDPDDLRFQPFACD